MFSSSALLLGGCGGGGGTGGGGTGGGGSGADALTYSRGAVVLPAGFIGPVAGLRVSAPNAGPVGADGSFAYDNVGNRPNFILATNSSDKPVLLGISDPASGKPAEISASKTAVALVFWALDSYSLPTSDQAAAIGLIAGHPALGPLTSVISTELASNPTALGDFSPAILAAVKQTRDAIRNDTRAAFLFNPQVRIANRASKSAQVPSRAAASPTHRSTREAGPPVQMVIEPSGGPFSGLIAHQSDDNKALIITNTRRRELMYYIQQTGYRDKNPDGSAGEEHELEKEIAENEWLQSTSKVPGAIVGLAEAAAGGGAYQPVNSEPIALPVYPDGSAESTYHVTVVGPGIDSPNPPKFGAEKYAPGYNKAAALTFGLDMLLPSIATLLNINYEPAGIALSSEVVIGFEAIFHSCLDLPEFVNAARLKEFEKLPKIVLAAMATNPTFREKLLLTLTNSVLNRLPHLSKAWLTALKAETFLRQLNVFVKYLDTALALADFAVIAHDIADSHMFEEWDVKVRSTKVKINPVNADINVTETAPFAAVVQADTTGKVMVYHWTTSGSFGDMSDTVGHRGTEFDTSSPSVTFRPNSKGYGTDWVTVEVFEKVNTERISYGSNGAQVTVRKIAPLLVPRKVELLEGESQTFEARVDAALNDGGTLTYLWSSTSNFGKLTSVPVNTETASSQAVYKSTSSTDGDDTITVEIFSTKNFERKALGVAHATAKTVHKKTIIQGRYYVRTFERGPNGFGGTTYGIEATVAFPKVAGAKSYAVHCYGFNDTDYYGKEANFGPFTEPVSGLLVTGNEYSFGIAGASGGVDGIAQAVNYYTQRFKGMVVEVTVNY